MRRRAGGGGSGGRRKKPPASPPGSPAKDSSNEAVAGDVETAASGAQPGSVSKEGEAAAQAEGADEPVRNAQNSHTEMQWCPQESVCMCQRAEALAVRPWQCCAPAEVHHTLHACLECRCLTYCSCSLQPFVAMLPDGEFQCFLTLPVAGLGWRRRRQFRGGQRRRGLAPKTGAALRPF